MEGLYFNQTKACFRLQAIVSWTKFMSQGRWAGFHGMLRTGYAGISLANNRKEQS